MPLDVREDVAWIGGLWEGEGHFVHDNSRASKHGANVPSAVVHMTDEDVVRRLQGAIGFGHVYGPYGPYGKGKERGWKPYWAYRAYGLEKTQALIAAIYPWLGERRRAQARDVLRRRSNG